MHNNLVIGIFCNVASVPENKTRSEGMVGVPFVCPFSINRAPIWKINDSIYDPFSLPVLLQPTVDGINVTVVEKSYNQTRFQCFAPSGNGLQVEASDVATLTVTEKRKL